MSWLMAFLVLLFSAEQLQLQGQQSYVNNKQLRCYETPATTLGFVCNAAPSCTSYLSFRSTPIYNTPAAIGYLLAADPSQIATANNISDVASLPIDTLLIVPVNCSCSGGEYYQHNASYVLKQQGETYFEVANITYQALTTCQSLMAQNPYNDRRLFPGMRLNVPLRCACPTPAQTASAYNYLLTYLLRQGDTVEYIARTFAADVQAILHANMLTQDQRIFFFTPILVPLKTPPTIHTTPSPPPTPLLPTTPAPDDSSSRRWVFIGVGIGAAILVILSSALAAVWLCRRRQQQQQLKPPKLALADEAVSSSSWSEGIRSATETLTVYKFEDLEKATNWFAESNRINGSSSVYRGSFKGDDGVVKIMKGDVSGEVAALRKINHSHVIRLSGFCLCQGITYLVYEYAEKGCLAQWLHSNKGLPLNWKHRVQIAYDVADALNYLHNFTNPPYIHKNLTSSNILVDGNMRAKIANFGLSRTLDTGDQGLVTRHVVGTYGYMAPEYIETGLVTPKLDVFALGVVMLELLSGKEAISIEGDQKMLHRSIQEVLGGGENVREKLREFMDPSLGEEYPLEMGYSMGELARRCVAHSLDARPLVSEVFMALSKLLSFSMDWDPSLDETSRSFSE